EGIQDKQVAVNATLKADGCLGAEVYVASFKVNDSDVPTGAAAAPGYDPVFPGKVGRPVRPLAKDGAVAACVGMTVYIHRARRRVGPVTALIVMRTTLTNT